MSLGTLLIKHGGKYLGSNKDFFILLSLVKMLCIQVKYELDVENW